jgi:hypothetical protein
VQINAWDCANWRTRSFNIDTSWKTEVSFQIPDQKRRPPQSRADEAYNIMEEAVEKRNQRDSSTIYYGSPN